MDILESRRAELVQELICFDDVNTSDDRRRDWGLPLSWKWDSRGGPMGQEISGSEALPGVEYYRHSFDIKLSLDDPNHVSQRTALLGKGAFGTVERIVCNGKVVARKRTKLNVERPHMSRRELRVMKQLNHPNIARLLGLIVRGEYIYILSYPVAEMTLMQYITLNNNGKQNGNWFNTLYGGMGCLSNALAYMHASGIKHGDIYDQNVLILGGSLILCDFGQAQ
jgi:hypothetical protein